MQNRRPQNSERKASQQQSTPWPWMGMIASILIFSSWVVQNVQLQNAQAKQAFLARADDLVRHQELLLATWNQVYLQSKYSAPESLALSARAAHFAYSAHLIGTAYNGARSQRALAEQLIEGAEAQADESWDLLGKGEYKAVIDKYTALNQDMNKSQLSSKLNMLADIRWGEAQGEINRYTNYYLLCYLIGGILGAWQYIRSFRRRRACSRRAT
jgi:hypothetical protein